MPSIAYWRRRPGGAAPAAGGPATGSRADLAAPIARAFAANINNPQLDARDRAWLASLVSQRTGLPQAEAEKRVDEAFAELKAAEQKARDAADKARKAALIAGFLAAATMAIGRPRPAPVRRSVRVIATNARWWCCSARDGSGSRLRRSPRPASRPGVALRPNSDTDVPLGESNVRSLATAAGHVTYDRWMEGHNAGGSGRQADVIVIGAGVAGLYQLHRLRGLGLRVQVFEAGTDVGGTWYWNRYPGARFDSESWSYGYSFSEELLQEWEWPEHFAAQPDTLRYLNYVADKFDLRRDIRFGCRVAAAHFDERSDRWTITLESGEQASARF